jgi:hypothetical protein
MKHSRVIDLEFILTNAGGKMFLGKLAGLLYVIKILLPFVDY